MKSSNQLRFSEWWRTNIRIGDDGEKQRERATSFVVGKEIAIQRNDFDDYLLFSGTRPHLWHIARQIVDPAGALQCWTNPSGGRNKAFPDGAQEVVTWCGRHLQDVYLDIADQHHIPAENVCMVCFKQMILNTILLGVENKVVV